MARKRKKRYVSGLIIRLIDVVMILLFGFIAISELSKKTKIKLAKSSTVPATYPDRERVLYIGVLPDGRYLVDNETRLIASAEVLAKYLDVQRQAHVQTSTRLRVRLRASHNTPVKYAFPVVNICKEMSIPVGLDVIRTNRK